MPIVFGFDVYGTLVDPLGMERQLTALFGDRGNAICALWRQKQLEYSFRRGLMQCYEDFDACTQRALSFAAKTFKVELSDAAQRQLLTDYLNLPAFPDVVPALETLKASGCTPKEITPEFARKYPKGSSSEIQVVGSSLKEQKGLIRILKKNGADFHPKRKMTPPFGSDGKVGTNLVALFSEQIQRCIASRTSERHLVVLPITICARLSAARPRGGLKGLALSTV